MDYALPRAEDFPALDVVHVAFPSAVNELGIKGVGASGVIAPGAMIAGAVEDALAHRGVTIDPLPATPARVFAAGPSLYAFAYTVPGATPAPTYVVAGAGEMRDRAQGPEGIVRKGETSPEAMKEKARFVMEVMQDRMRTLGADWRRATTIDVYTA